MSDSCGLIWMDISRLWISVAWQCLNQKMKTRVSPEIRITGSKISKHSFIISYGNYQPSIRLECVSGFECLPIVITQHCRYPLEDGESIGTYRV